MPTTYIYVRVSHRDSAESGISPEAQTERARAYYEFAVKPKDVPLHPEVFYDEAVSASRVRLWDRAEGAKLNAIVRPGDHVIFARLDRAFRNLHDYTTIITQWKARNIAIHFADLGGAGCDLSTSTGSMVAATLAVVAQWYSDQLSERAKEVSAYLKKMNRSVNGKKMLGFKLVRGQWAPDPNDRAIMCEIERLHDKEGKTFQECSDHIERRLCKLEKREYKEQTNWVKRQWSRARCQAACLRWKDIVETGT